MTRKAHPVRDRLAGGAARGLGPANALVEESLRDPEVLRELIAALADGREIVTIRAANALKKVQQREPELLLPHARALLRAAATCQDTRTRWNLILVVGELPLQGRSKALAVDLLFEALDSESGFLRTFALTGLANLALHDAALRRRVRPMVAKALTDESAAMRARARKLAKRLAVDAGED